MLKQWTIEQKDEYAYLSAQGLSVTAAERELRKSHPDLHSYNPEALRRFRHGDEGKELIQKSLTRIRNEAENRSFAHQGSRIDGLVRIAENLFTRLSQVSQEDVTKFVSLSGEFRQYMDAIRKEMAPYQSTEDAAISLFERWATLRDKAKKGDLWDETSVS